MDLWGDVHSGLYYLCELGKPANDIDKWGLGIVNAAQTLPNYYTTHKQGLYCNILQETNRMTVQIYSHLIFPLEKRLRPYIVCRIIRKA